jgi:hypothetical protein
MFRALVIAGLALLSCSLTAQRQVCKVVDGPVGCGPTLTASFTSASKPSYRLRVDVQGLHNNSVGALVFGTRLLNPPVEVVPGGGCFLLTDQYWTHIFLTGSSGRIRWEAQWPMSLQGAFYVQSGSLNLNAGPEAPLDVRTSNVKITTCRVQ